MNVDILNRSFFFAQLKVNRARRHFQEAQHLFAEYANGDCCEVVTETDPQTGHQEFRAVAKQIPADVVLAMVKTQRYIQPIANG